MALEPHATSKLTTIDDLETIKTFGFRGEALASINAISKLVLATQPAAALTSYGVASHGVQLTFEYGALLKKEIISRSPGTDISIAQIFSNIPVRKKFLKTRETEWRAIFYVSASYSACAPACGIYALS